MEYKDIHEEIEKLSVAERVEFVTEIWDGMARDNEAFELTDAQKEELDRRSREIEENPSIGIPWDEIKAKYLKNN